MSEYGNYTRRADLITNLVKRQEVAKQDVEKQRAARIQQENLRRWKEYQEQILMAEAAARQARQHAISTSSDLTSSGGSDGSPDEFDYVATDYVDPGYVD